MGSTIKHRLYFNNLLHDALFKPRKLEFTTKPN
jgi:hypothetical protein